jgi:hypothetical protein
VGRVGEAKRKGVIYLTSWVGVIILQGEGNP